MGVERNTWFQHTNSLDGYIKVITKKRSITEYTNNVVHVKVSGTDINNTTEDFVRSILQDASENNRPIVVINKKIENPTYQEVEDITKVNALSIVSEECKKIAVYIEQDLGYINQLERQVEQGFKGLSESQLKNYTRVLQVWLVRYLNKLLVQVGVVPIFIFWGEPTAKEDYLIKLLSIYPIDIVQVSLNKEKEESKDEHPMAWYKPNYVELPMSMETPKRVPELQRVTKLETVAHKAEQEIGEILYTDGLYKDMQFGVMNAVTLYTTYDEIKILLGVDAKYRQGFNTRNDIVTVPVLFTVVQGIDKGDIRAYEAEVESLKPRVKLPIWWVDKDLSGYVKQVYYNNKVDFERIKKSEYYNYGLYSKEVQALIQAKINELLSMDWCDETEEFKKNKLPYKILEVLLSIPKGILQQLQVYDFTKKVPLISIYLSGEEVLSLEDSILLMFCNLVGIDIVIYVPTGYNVVNRYIKEELMNIVNLGNYRFDLGYVYANKNRGELGLYGEYGNESLVQQALREGSNSSLVGLTRQEREQSRGIKGIFEKMNIFK